jgi:hypothetical protein
VFEKTGLKMKLETFLKTHRPTKFIGCHSKKKFVEMMGKK